MTSAYMPWAISFLVSTIIPRNFETHLASCVVAGHRSVCSFWSAVIESKWGNKAVTRPRKHCLLRLNVGQTKIVQVHRLLYISPVNQYKWGKHSVLVCLIFTHLIWKWHKKALTWIFLLIVGTQNWVFSPFLGSQNLKLGIRLISRNPKKVSHSISKLCICSIARISNIFLA